MGKIVRHDKPVGFFIIAALLILTAVQSHASYREHDLFQKGYECYLSYQPEKAAEEFRTFLEEFPRSSARDAALFWLGKSLMQSKSVEEAGKVFAELRRQYPESPFVAFIGMQSELPENEKVTIAKAADPPLPLESPPVPSESEQAQAAGKTDTALTEPAIQRESLMTPETPSENKAEEVMPSYADVPGQAEAPQLSAQAQTGPMLTAEDGNAPGVGKELLPEPADTMMAKVEESDIKRPETIKAEPAETENMKTVLEKTEIIASPSDSSSVASVQEQPAIPESDKSDATLPGDKEQTEERPQRPDEAGIFAGDAIPGENAANTGAGDGSITPVLPLYYPPHEQIISAYALTSPGAVFAESAPLEMGMQSESIDVSEAPVPVKDGDQPGTISIAEASTAPAPDTATTRSEGPEAQPSGEQGPVAEESPVQEPERTEAELTNPVVQEIAATEPDGRKPEIREPEAGTLEVKEPEVIELPLLAETGGMRETTENDDVIAKEEPAPDGGGQAQQDSAGDDKQGKTGELSVQEPAKDDAAAYARTALNKAGIQGAVWSTGDRDQDFIDEQILFNEAVRQDLSVSETTWTELVERYKLGLEEADYLKRFLLISQLIDRKAGDMPGEKSVEVLSIRYKDAVQPERPELAAELQESAKRGVPFREISDAHPDAVHYKTFPFQELPEWVQERIQGLQNEEIGVIWSEEGYMILKPVTEVYSYDPFEEMPPRKKEKIAAHIRAWIEELKGAAPR